MKISLKNTLMLSFTFVILFLVSIIIFSSFYSTKEAIFKNTNIIMNNMSDFVLDKTKNYLITARDAANLTQRLKSENVVTSKNTNMINIFMNN